MFLALKDVFRIAIISYDTTPKKIWGYVICCDRFDWLDNDTLSF